MKRSRFTQIGLDRLIRIAWLERTASLAQAGNDAKTTKAILQEDLKKSFQSEKATVRGSLDKTITILLKVWLKAPTELETLRAEGLYLLQRVPRRDHLAVHWGMVTAVYPFWSGVAMQVGRLLKLQGSVTAAHVQRRVREQYGERETVSRRTRYILRSYLDWAVLKETGIGGIYKACAPVPVNDSCLIAWLIETSVHARSSGSGSLKELLVSPSLFPFRIKAVRAEDIVAASTNLDTLRHGLDADFVMLRKPPGKSRTDG